MKDLPCNYTIKRVEKTSEADLGTCGQTDDVDKKFMKFDEVVKLVQAAVKEPEHTGNYHDYVELCKLYDKNENGTMMLAELETFLSLMGKFFGPTAS